MKRCSDLCATRSLTARKLRRTGGAPRNLVFPRAARGEELFIAIFRARFPIKNESPRASEEATYRRAYFSTRTLITGTPKAMNVNRGDVIRFAWHKYLWLCNAPRCYATRVNGLRYRNCVTLYVYVSGVNSAAAHPELLWVSYVKIGSIPYIVFRQIGPRSRCKYSIVQLRKEDYVEQGWIDSSLVGETMASIISPLCK